MSDLCLSLFSVALTGDGRDWVVMTQFEMGSTDGTRRRCLYDYAKQNLGPLLSAVGTVEGTVTAIVGPVYQKLKGVPDDLLVFLDNKVPQLRI
ncbi:hypothetical protein FH972_013419 [Carpinus fangiana]|uniref:Uncharacterized protein n=1 Tax=Carpinus fangiana TaxID=176857 RepID=A0A5N6R7P4_9ROSI|nr:hypothetical protein FH972_013419 [Carpinus fangiana]